MAMLDAARRVRELQEVNSLSAEEIERARKYIADCNYALALSSDFLSGVITNTMRKVPTEVIDTLAVTHAADGFEMMLYSPTFTLQLADEPGTVPHQGKFCLAHEARHLIDLHLHGTEHQGDEVWTMATEARINRATMKHLKMGLPVIDGKPTGIDPDKVYADYRKDLRDRGKTPVSMDELYKSDLTCYYELKRMSVPPKPKRGTMQICAHTPGGSGGAGNSGSSCSCSDPNGKQQGGGKSGGKSGGQPEQGNGQQQPGQGGGASQPQTDPRCPVHGPGRIVLDPKKVDERVSQVLDIAIQEATQNGNRTAKAQLLDLADASAGSDRASQIWGDHGLGALRGEAAPPTRTDYWQQWVEGKLADRLEPALRLVRQRKIWWEEQFRYNGSEPHMLLNIYIDASGSMRQSDLDWIAKKVGDTEGLTTRWFSFDASIYPVEPGSPGETGSIRGGGGTSFQIIEDDVQDSDDEDPDAILVVTDGHAPHITPADPDKWVWLITPGGSTWPDSHEVPMDCFEIDTTDPVSV
jgi:predicted metal-dependent peptidase